MSKRVIAVLLALVLIFSLSGCNTNNNTPPPQGNENNGQQQKPVDNDKPFRVALLFSGFRGDKSYLDFVYAGAHRAEEELGIELKLLESDNSADWESNLIAMANEGYDTCPLEGLDSRRLKRILKLPHGAEINMVIPCGIRDGNKGIWGERCRVPFDEVYRRI